MGAGGIERRLEGCCESRSACAKMAVVKPPLLTIRCDCGANGQVPHGQCWTCDSCGRVYDTSKIPEGDYRAIRGIQRRYRAIGWVLATIVAGFVLFLAISNQPFQIGAGLPIILIAWFTYVRPIMRRRYRRAIASRPRWELAADDRPADEL
jgi:hypothetical protein